MGNSNYRGYYGRNYGHYHYPGYGGNLFLNFIFVSFLYIKLYVFEIKVIITIIAVMDMGTQIMAAVEHCVVVVVVVVMEEDLVEVEAEVDLVEVEAEVDLVVVVEEVVSNIKNTI